jgi:ketosteroid isomerase-like protein
MFASVRIGYEHQFVSSRRGGPVSTSDTAAIATTCLEAWSTGDLATVRSLLREDITLDSPLGSAGGVEASINRMADWAQQVSGTERRKIFVDGDDVCIMYDLITVTAGTVPTSDWYHIENGKIDSVRAHFDSRRLGADHPGPTSECPGVPQPVAGRPYGAPRLPALISAEMELAATDY